MPGKKEKSHWFPMTFWTANSMEIMERWAWYGMFAVFAIYLTNSTDEGALGFSQTQKGTMMGVVTALLYLLPLITGAVADRFGYKKILLLAYAMMASGYFMLGTFTSYSAVFMAFIYVALGAALFKPVISATVAKTTDDSNSSIGFGIFYMMVNIGGFVGPFCAKLLRTDISWESVFWMSSAVISVNFILVLFFYRDPSLKDGENERIVNVLDYFRILGVFFLSTVLFVTAFSVFVLIYFIEVPLVLLSSTYGGENRLSFRFSRWVSTRPIGESNKRIFTNIVTVFEDSSFIIFVLLIIGFWTMFNQIFYTLPNFIDQWGDTTGIYSFLHSISPGLANVIGTENGIIPPEMMINLDAGSIIIFQLLISALVMRFKPLHAMISGIIVCSIGVGVSFMTANGWFIVLGIFVFALGEMASSPKITEYIGKIAPKDKVGLYMGFSFLPVAGGNLMAGILSGAVYEAVSDKISLLRTEVAARGLTIPEIGSKVGEAGKVFTKNDYIARAAELMNTDKAGLEAILWEQYSPDQIWYVFFAIGIVTAVLLVLYDRIILKNQS